MSAIEAAPTEGPDQVRQRLRLRWWKEVLYVIVFYFLYSAVRNTFGSAGAVSEGAINVAYEHARDIIRYQDAIRLWFEPELQRWYLDLPGRGGIRFWNIYYGTAHFIVTVVALVVLFRKDPKRYPTWRNTLAAMTAVALIGYASYSLMPPRLLDDSSLYGACRDKPANCNGYGMVDTLADYGGLWSFDDSAMAKVSNQYAAMPSMHTGWSTWCAFVLVPMFRRRWAKVLMALYPAATVFCIMITANHYWLDAVGGWVALAVGYLIGSNLARWTAGRRSPASIVASGATGSTGSDGAAGPIDQPTDTARAAEEPATVGTADRTGADERRAATRSDGPAEPVGGDTSDGVRPTG